MAGVANVANLESTQRLDAAARRLYWVRARPSCRKRLTNGGRGSASVPHLSAFCAEVRGAPRPYRQTGYAKGRPFPDGLCLVSHRGFEPRTLWLKAHALPIVLSVPPFLALSIFCTWKFNGIGVAFSWQKSVQCKQCICFFACIAFAFSI